MTSESFYDWQEKRRMSEEGRVFWPGQVFVLTFDKDQFKALASSSRATIYWMYGPEHPLTVNEIGELTGFTPQAVRYHTNALLKVGLLLHVETRKSRSRIQEAYVTKGVYSKTPPPPTSEEILKIKRKAFQAAWHQFERDRAAVNKLENIAPEKGVRTNLRRSMVRLKQEDIKKFHEAADQLIEQFIKLEDPEGTLYTLVAYFCPAFGESAKEYRELTGQKLSVSERNQAADDDE